MRDQRIIMMNNMAEALRNRQNVFEVLTDEEFYNSPYGQKRREKKNTASNLDFFHVLIPGSSRNLFAVYFKVDRIAFAMSPGFECFSSSIPFTKRRPKDRYWEYNISSVDMNELYQLGLDFSLELMEYAIKMHTEYDALGKWEK